MGGVKTLFNDMSFSENRDSSYPYTYNTLRPLINTNANYSDEELANIAKKSNNGKHNITERDVVRVDGAYGSTKVPISVVC